MPHSCWFTLVASGLESWAAPEAASIDPGSLARIAGRGRLRFGWDRRDPGQPLRSWQRGLLSRFGAAQACLASAPISALGAGLAGAEGYWLHAEPVHLIAGLDRLTFVSLHSDAGLTQEEREVLAEALSSQFPYDAFTWQATSAEWFVRSDFALDAITSSPDAAGSNELREMLPRGNHGALLRKLMTELQTALHEHPVNLERERRGLPTANAIWLWGGGTLESKAIGSPPLPCAWAEDSFTRGLYRALQLSEPAPLMDVEQLIAQASAQSRALAVVPVHNAIMLEKEWIGHLLKALGSRRLGGFDVILDQWHLEADRAALRRFWRRPIPLAQWKAPE